MRLQKDRESWAGQVGGHGNGPSGAQRHVLPFGNVRVSLAGGLPAESREGRSGPWPDLAPCQALSHLRTHTP